MRIVVVIILISCIAGCRDKDGLPSGILKNEKMQAVLWDVIQAEAFTTQFIKKDTLKNAPLENAKLQQQIFAIHKISKEDFYDSYNYYIRHVDLMRTLLDSIASRGEREKYKTLYSKPAIPAPISLLPTPTSPPPIPIPMPIPTLTPTQKPTPILTPTPIPVP